MQLCLPRVLEQNRLWGDQEEQECIKNNDERKNVHNDIPLTIKHEEELLKEAGFKSVEIKETDQDNYRLFLAKK